MVSFGFIEPDLEEIGTELFGLEHTDDVLLVLVMGDEKTRSFRILIKLHVQLGEVRCLSKVLSATDNGQMVLQKSNTCCPAGRIFVVSTWQSASASPGQKRERGTRQR